VSTTIAREICGGGSHSFSIYDHEVIASLILKLIGDDDLKKSLIVWHLIRPKNLPGMKRLKNDRLIS